MSTITKEINKVCATLWKVAAYRRNLEDNTIQVGLKGYKDQLQLAAGRHCTKESELKL